MTQAEHTPSHSRASHPQLHRLCDAKRCQRHETEMRLLLTYPPQKRKTNLNATTLMEGLQKGER